MDTPEFGPVRSESTAAIVARSLRDMIAQGRLKQGQQLLEVELAKSFGVSRGILREALQRLTQEGLLLSRPNRGVFVAELGPDEVFDIFTARLAIERAACLKVIDVMGFAPRLADELDELTVQLTQKLERGASTEELVALDLHFHEHMVAAAQSPRLTRMYATLATETRMCHAALEPSRYPMRDRISEHRKIAEAIRRSDVPTLHQVLAQHMDHAVDQMLSGGGAAPGLDASVSTEA